MPLTNIARTALAAALLTASIASASQAQTLLTSRPTFGTTIDFSTFTPGVFYATGSVNGVSIDPISDDSFYAIGSYGLLGNGSWYSSGSNASGIGTSYGFGSFLRFTFADPVTAAGGFLNYCVSDPLSCNGFSATLRAYDADFNLLGAYDIDTDAPIATTLDNDGAFRGIQVDSPEIKYLDYGGSYVAMGDLTYGDPAVTSTPEPAAILLMATGMTGVGVIVRRRRAKA